MGLPIMSSQKMGPSCRAICIRSCIGALALTESILPTSSLRGGWGMGWRGLSLAMRGTRLFGGRRPIYARLAGRANKHSGAWLQRHVSRQGDGWRGARLRLLRSRPASLPKSQRNAPSKIESRRSLCEDARNASQRVARSAPHGLREGLRMKHLSGIDASFLHLETPEMPMHVGSLNIFDLPKGYKGDFYEDVKAHIASRMHLAEVFERKLAQMPFELSGPVWVDDSDVDLDYHIRHVVLPRPGTFRQLEQMVG